MQVFIFVPALHLFLLRHASKPSLSPQSDDLESLCSIERMPPTISRAWSSTTVISVSCLWLLLPCPALCLCLLLCPVCMLASLAEAEWTLATDCTRVWDDDARLLLTRSDLLTLT